MKLGTARAEVRRYTLVKGRSRGGNKMGEKQVKKGQPKL